MAKGRKYPKAPRKPKASASLAQHEAYHQRVKEWQRKCVDIDKEKAERERADPGQQDRPGAIAERERAAKKTQQLHSHISGVKRRGR